MEVKGTEMFPSVVNEECQLQKISASQKQQIIEPFLCRLLVVAIGVLLTRPGLTHGVEDSARASIPHPPAPYVEPNEPITKTLSEAEAVALLESDWLFQAENEPTVKKVFDEIRWACKLASRLEMSPKGPNLRNERQELLCCNFLLNSAFKLVVNNIHPLIFSA